MMIQDDKLLYLARAVQADECRRSFFYFLRTFWHEVIKEDPVYNWHIAFLCGELQLLAQTVFERRAKLYDMIINIPPGTTKSTIATVMWPAWMWAVDPTIRVISNSYSSDISLDHASKSKDIITCDRYMSLFPDVRLRRDKTGKGAYDNTKGGTRYATSSGSAVTGKHAHVIINDDPQNPGQAASEAFRLQANLHTATLSSRKTDKKVAVTVVIMQRLHEEDVTGYLLKRKGDAIRHICLPAELSDRVHPAGLGAFYRDGLLDAVRMDRAVLDEALVDLGSKAYAGQMGQSPSVDGGDIVKREWFGICSESHYLAIRGKHVVDFFLDTAYSERDKGKDNDPSGIIGCCVIGHKLYVTCAAKVWKDFPSLIKWIPQWVMANGYASKSKVEIEPKANGKSIVQQLRADSGLNVKELVVKNSNESKLMRLNSVSPIIECGRVVLVEGNWNEGFLDEVCGFPSRVHDEYVDVLGYAINRKLPKRIQVPSGVDKDMLGIM